MSRTYSQHRTLPVSSPVRPRGMLYVSIGFAVLAIIIILMMIFMEGVTISSDFYGIVAGVIALGGAWGVALLLCQRRDAGANWLNPMYGLGLWYFLHFGVMAIYNYFNPPMDIMPPLPIKDMLPTGVWAAVLGYVSLLVGYFMLPVRRSKPRSAAARLEWLTEALERTSSRRALLIICLCVGWPKRLYLLYTGNYHFGVEAIDPDSTISNSLSATFAILESFTLLAIFIASVGIWKKRKYLDGALLFVILLADMGWGFATGSKQYAFMPLTTAFGAWYGLSPGASRSRKWIYIGLISFFMIILFPLFNAYRNAPTRVDSPLSAWEQALTEHSLLNYDILSGGADAAAKRIGGIVPLSLVVQFTPSSWDYQYGQTFYSAIFAPIPRFIWVDKPPAFDKVGFGQAYFLQGADNFTTAQTPTVPGEMYLNFGWFGIVFGMMLYGAILRLIWDWYRRTGQAPGPLLILLITWSNVLVIDGLFSDYLPGVPRQVVIILIALWMVTQFFKPAPRAGGRRLQRNLISPG